MIPIRNHWSKTYGMETEKELRILMLEDSMEDVELIDRVLRKDNIVFTRQAVDTRDEFNSAIKSFEPDVILSDHGLPGFNSREALKICLKERAHVPFILVTGSVSDDYAISCIREGADDYILKSNLSRLPTAIRSALKRRKLEKLKREARHALRQQNDALRKVNQELDNFVYSVSHNLRGPLASVIGLLNLAKTEDSVESIKPLLYMMDTNVARLDETLAEILEYSRNARSEIQLGEIDWTSLLQATLAKLEYLDPGNRVEKTITLNTTTPFFSDGSRIRTILTNIISNAIIYSSKDRRSYVQIEVTTLPNEAQIVIRDNGIGIDDHIRPFVFNMFYRGTEESRGAGLGLYIAREVVNKLQGSIALEAQPNKGTTVTLRFPNVVSCELNFSVPVNGD